MTYLDTTNWPAVPAPGQFYFIDRDVQLDGQASTLLGTAIFTFEDVTFSNERHEDVPGQRAELRWLQIGFLRLTREQCVLAVGEAEVAAWESGATDMVLDGHLYDEVRLEVA